MQHEREFVLPCHIWNQRLNGLDVDPNQAFVSGPNNDLHEHPSAACSRHNVPTRIAMSPASIFWTVLAFNPANSASRSCVRFAATRARRRLPPSSFSLDFSA